MAGVSGCIHADITVFPEEDGKIQCKVCKRTWANRETLESTKGEQIISGRTYTVGGSDEPLTNQNIV